MEAAAIVDIGSGFLKAGLQTDAAPTVILPSLVGRPRKRYAAEYEGCPSFVGDEAIVKRSQLTFHYPIDHGHICDWHDFEALLEHVLLKSGLPLDASGLSTRGVLMTEPPLTSAEYRTRLVELLLELFEAGEVCLQLQGILSLYACGRTSGLVVDVGDGVTQIVPVHDGFVDRTSIRRSDFGGQELTLYLQKLLCDNGLPLTTRDDLEHVRQIKEQLCYVAADPYEEDERTDLARSYHLPDGLTLRDGASSIEVGAERFYCPEVLFEPKIMQRDCPPLTELIWQAVLSSPLEARKTALANVVVSGGTTMFPGFPERLQAELRRLAPVHGRAEVRVHPVDNRLFGVWNGAKTFCTPTMRPMQDLFWITKDDWLEEGPSVVERKSAFNRS